MFKVWKSIVLLFFLIFLARESQAQSGSDKREYGQQFFDSQWKFALGDAAEYSASSFDDSNWRILNLPHDWSIEGKSVITNPSGGEGGFFPMGTAWYRKQFMVPSKWQTQKVFIYFEGVYMNAQLFINGKSVGIQPYGYTSFEYDLSPFLVFGKQNTIAVRVDNSKQTNSRWYSGSGIYRHVWLKVKEKLHVKNWGVAVATSLISPIKAEVQVKTAVKNETDIGQKFQVSSFLIDNKGKTIAKNSAEYEMQSHQEKELQQTLIVENPLLWGPESPNLYQLKVNVFKEGKLLDAITKNIGIRTIAFSAENGFLLNGKKTILNGGCVHHDNGSLGAAAYDRAEIRKVELLKAAGFNALRTSHNPPSEAFLDACDRLGMLVIDESFDGWKEKKTPYDYAGLFEQWWKHDLESMVLRDRNHPSIILWSVGNEIIERKKPEAVETAQRLVAAAHRLDATRGVTSAMTTWDKSWDIFDPLMAAHDVAGYNYQLHRAEADHKRVPSRIIVQTESYPKDAFANWKLVQNHNYIIGDFVWTAMDYLGESGIGRYFYAGEPEGEHWEKNLFPWHGAYCGDLDLMGQRKAISHYRSMLYNDKEKLYMAVREPNPANGAIKLTSWAVWPSLESWTYPTLEGKILDVEVFSKYPKVRLYLNEKLIGEKDCGIHEEFKVIFPVPYSSGELKAVGIENDKEVESVILKTAAKASKIGLSADRKVIMADGQDLCYIAVSITDHLGLLDPNASNQLNFKVSGAAEIVGIDNGNLKDTDLYTSHTRKAWYGRALLIIKSKGEGAITIEVSSPELEKSAILIHAVRKQ